MSTCPCRGDPELSADGKDRDVLVAPRRRVCCPGLSCGPADKTLMKQAEVPWSFALAAGL